MKKYFKYILLIIALALGYGYYLYNKPHKNMKKVKVEHSLNATQLFTDYETDEAKADTKYLGKVIEVNGTIKDISKNDKGLVTIILDCDSDMFGISCQFDEFSKHENTNFKAGEKITLRGECTGMLMDVVLVRCIVI